MSRTGYSGDVHEERLMLLGALLSMSNNTQLGHQADEMK
jgi:hypothetical protein